MISLLSRSVYKIFVPLPFKKGDIVKVEHFFGEPDYGGISCEWKRPEERARITMWISLDVYDSVTEDFDYTDGGSCNVLYSYICPDEELPQEKQILKLIRAVRRGDLDFQVLLHKFGKRKWRDF